MAYWLQELQQKRWEYCNGLDAATWDSRASPAPGDFSQGLVARDNSGKSGAGGRWHCLGRGRVTGQGRTA